MCRRVLCQTCQKPTYTGCGKHVEQVLRGVVDADRCQCREVAALGASVAHQHQSLPGVQLHAVHAK